MDLNVYGFSINPDNIENNAWIGTSNKIISYC